MRLFLPLACAGVAVWAAACSERTGAEGLAPEGGGASPPTSASTRATTSISTGCENCTDVSTGGFAPPPVDTSAVVLAASPPPALSGGTLALLSDGVTAFAADPDRDAVVWADLSTDPPVVRTLALSPGDEPGRVAEDAAGLVHVALRRSGVVATIDPVGGTIVRRVAVCAAPRGIAYDASLDALFVACVDGSLFTLDPADGSVLRTVTLDDDLRDVVPLGAGLLAVTRFRAAEMLLVDAGGVVRSRTTPSGAPHDAADVAFRAVAVAGRPGVVVMTHQLASTRLINVDLAAGAYGGDDGLGTIVAPAITTFRFDLDAPDAAPAVKTRELLAGASPVDVSIDPTDATASTFAVATPATRAVRIWPASAHGSLGVGCSSLASDATSVAYDASGDLVVFQREPAAFVTLAAGADAAAAVVTAVDGAISVEDTGFDLFERAPVNELLGADATQNLACASCHPEGREDGRVWKFSSGARRTQSLGGGLLATAPFHWNGDLPAIADVMALVYTQRMRGPQEPTDHVAALERFLDALPIVSRTPPAPSSSIAHGQALFESTDVGCSTCHSGPHLTSNATVDVGTGGRFQVPSLVGVGLRAPYLHDGRAATLTQRFTNGGGDQHGHTSQLSESDVADLVAYLGTL